MCRVAAIGSHAPWKRGYRGKWGKCQTASPSMGGFTQHGSSPKSNGGKRIVLGAKMSWRMRGMASNKGKKKNRKKRSGKSRSGFRKKTNRVRVLKEGKRGTDKDGT